MSKESTNLLDLQNPTEGHLILQKKLKLFS